MTNNIDQNKFGFTEIHNAVTANKKKKLLTKIQVLTYIADNSQAMKYREVETPNGYRYELQNFDPDTDWCSEDMEEFYLKDRKNVTSWILLDGYSASLAKQVYNRCSTDVQQRVSDKISFVRFIEKCYEVANGK